MVELGRDGPLAIEVLEQRLARARVERDRAFIENLLAPEWTVTDPSGTVLTRQQVLDETFSSFDRQIESMTVDDVAVKMLGTTRDCRGPDQRPVTTRIRRHRGASIPRRLSSRRRRVEGGRVARHVDRALASK